MSSFVDWTEQPQERVIRFTVVWSITLIDVNIQDRWAYLGNSWNERQTKNCAWQILPGAGAPLSLNLGDLSDIAIMGATNERLRLDPNLPSGKR